MADREKMINEARAYQSNLIPKARGDARTQLGEAEAYKQQRIAEAVGGSPVNHVEARRAAGQSGELLAAIIRATCESYGARCHRSV